MDIRIWQHSQNTPKGKTPSTPPNPRPPHQTPTSTLARAVVSGVSSRPGESRARTSSAHIDAAEPTTPARISPDAKLSGPCPEWAYYYTPPLSLSQAIYVQERMRPEEEYSGMTRDARHSVMARDLKNALTSMRQVFNRSSEVLDTRRAPSSTASSMGITARLTQLEQRLPGSATKATSSATATASSGDESDSDVTITDGLDVQDSSPQNSSLSSQNDKRQFQGGQSPRKRQRISDEDKQSTSHEAIRPPGALQNYGDKVTSISPSPFPVDFESPVADKNWKIVRGFFTVRDFPPPPPGPVRDLLYRPQQRRVEFRTTSTKFSHVLWPKDVSALIVQLVGQKAPTPCSFCERDTGVFVGCVMVPQEVADVIQGGLCSCVNCAWKGKRRKVCDLKEVLGQGTHELSAKTTEKASENALGSQSFTSQTEGSAQVDEVSDKGPRRLRARRSEKPSTQHHSEEHTTTQTLQSRCLNPHTAFVQERQAAINAHAESGSPGSTLAGDRGMIKSSQIKTTRVDDNFSFSVETIQSGATLRVEGAAGVVRICTLASGKVMVHVSEELRFKLGPQGIFRLVPRMVAEVSNLSSLDAILHISSLKMGK